MCKSVNLFDIKWKNYFFMDFIWRMCGIVSHRQYSRKTGSVSCADNRFLKAIHIFFTVLIFHFIHLSF